MAQPKGKPKTPGSGRKKGTPNKINMDLERLCNETGIDPFMVLLKYTQDPDPVIAIAAAKECCRYIYPQRKALEVTTSDTGFRVIVEDYINKT